MIIIFNFVGFGVNVIHKAHFTFHIRAVHAYIPHKGSACIYFLMSHADTIFQLVDFDFYSVNSRSFSSSELWEDDYQPGQTTRIFSPHKTASTGIYPATQSSVTPSVGIQPSVRVNVLNTSYSCLHKILQLQALWLFA